MSNIRDHKTRVLNSSHVQISEAEGERLEAEMGVTIPKLNTSGNIKHKGKVIGYANNFSGICITDKEFILVNRVNVQWYVNERL
jgi:hypothetical protein